MKSNKMAYRYVRGRFRRTCLTAPPSLNPTTQIANRLRNVASTSGRSSGARSSGYGAVEPWRRKNNSALRQKKTLVQPEWNDRP